MMQQQTNANSAVPITTSAGILNLDHYKYLRSLLPHVPHFIESLSFTDLNNWECQIYVNLVNESDCIKWLADFEDKTSTEWKADHVASRSMVHQKGCHWRMVYRCAPLDCKKECTARLEMKIVQEEGDRGSSKHGKQYPSQVSINFYHNHNTTPNTAIFSAESFKSQDIPSHLKEGFEGYFQETMQPVTQSNTVTIKAQNTTTSLLNSPLTHTLAKAGVMAVGHLSAGAVQHLDGKLLSNPATDLANVSTKLDQALELLKAMLRQTGTPGSNAVRQFVEKFQKLRGDQAQLQDALTSFGGQWDWLGLAQAPDSDQVQQQQQVVQQPVQQQPSPPISPHDLDSLRRKCKKPRDDEPDIVTTATTTLASLPQQVFSTSIVGGQVLVQQQQAPVQQEGPDAKRRKRARCGTCSGCLNRDKTQDCRQCRNCLDQKRYGGPGRLKKACVKRQCVVISQMIGSELSPEQKTAAVVKTEPAIFSVKTEPLEQNSMPQIVTTHQPLPVSVSAAQVSQADHTMSLQTGPQVAAVVNQQPLSTISTAASQVSLSSPTPLSTMTTPTLLSWPGAHYAPIQVQVQQPVQFAFQPQGYAGAGLPAGAQIQYTTGPIQQLGTSQLESIASEAARHHGLNK